MLGVQKRHPFLKKRIQNLSAAAGELSTSEGHISLAMVQLDTAASACWEEAITPQLR